MYIKSVSENIFLLNYAESFFPELDTGLSGDNQFGFQKGVGCPEVHRSLANVLIDLKSKKSPLYVCTLDLSTALNSINLM